MPRGKSIRVYDYVNHPYDQVRDVLTTSALPAFSRATKGASARVATVASELHITVAGIDVGKEIEIRVVDVKETARAGKKQPGTRVRFQWRAKKAPRLFPLMEATLEAYPLTTTETQLDFAGTYTPPLGIVGSALDSVAGKRIAEASIHRFVNEVAAYLRAELD
jgi:hypothetical protein